MKASIFYCVSVLMCSGLLVAEEPSATISMAKGEVGRGLGKPPAPEQAALLKDRIGQRDYLRTGQASVAEVVLPASTLTRLGPLSVFRFSSESKNFILERGEGLFVFPKGRGGSTISTPSFSAGILGTTVYVKVDRNRVEYSCLEGRCIIGPHVLDPGEKLVIRGARQGYSAPKMRFDLDRFLRENPLIRDFDKPLSSLPLVQREAQLRR